MKCYTWVIFRKSVKKIKVSLKSDKNKGHFTWRKNTLSSYLAHFFLEREIFQTKVVEKIKTYILCSVPFIRKSCCVWDNVEKYYRAGQVTWQYGACALHAGIKATNTHTHCSCTATTTARTRLSLTIYVHCLSCFAIRNSRDKITLWSLLLASLVIP
jgi:hypothetical protein